MLDISCFASDLVILTVKHPDVLPKSYARPADLASALSKELDHFYENVR